MFRRYPILTGFLIVLAAWVGVALRATAAESVAESVIDSPVDAASLHEGPLEMTASYQPLGVSVLAVTATFAARDASAATRVVMPLVDGEGVAFSVPGYPQAVYRFLRVGDAVTVSVRPVALPIASGL